MQEKLPSFCIGIVGSRGNWTGKLREVNIDHDGIEWQSKLEQPPAAMSFFLKSGNLQPIRQFIMKWARLV